VPQERLKYLLPARRVSWAPHSRPLRQSRPWWSLAGEARRESRRLRQRAHALHERSQQLRQSYLLVVCAWRTKTSGCLCRWHCHEYPGATAHPSATPAPHGCWSCRRHLALQASGQAPSILFARMVAINQGTQPRIPRPPRSARRCSGSKT